MKKLMLFAFGIGLVTASCGSKEPQISSDKKDSMNIIVDTPASKDSTPMKSPDTIKIPVDTITTPVK